RRLGTPGRKAPSPAASSAVGRAILPRSNAGLSGADRVRRTSPGGISRGQSLRGVRSDRISRVETIAWSSVLENWPGTDSAWALILLAILEAPVDPVQRDFPGRSGSGIYQCHKHDRILSPN